MPRAKTTNNFEQISMESEIVIIIAMKFFLTLVDIYSTGNCHFIVGQYTEAIWNSHRFCFDFQRLWQYVKNAIIDLKTPQPFCQLGIFDDLWSMYDNMVVDTLRFAKNYTREQQEQSDTWELLWQICIRPAVDSSFLQ